MSPLLLSAVLLLSAGPTVVAQKGAPNYDARFAFSRNGKIAAATVPGGIRVFDLTTRRMLVELPLPNAAEVSVDDEGRRVLGEGRNDDGHIVRLFDLETEKFVDMGGSGRQRVPEVLLSAGAALSPDGKRVAIVGFPPDKDGTADTSRRMLSYWGIDGKKTSSIVRNSEPFGFDCKFDGNGDLWVQENNHVEHCRGTVCTSVNFGPWKLANASYVWTVSRDGKWLAGSYEEGSIQVALPDNSINNQIKIASTIILGIGLNSDGSEVTVASTGEAASAPSYVEVFKAATGERLHKIDLPQSLALPRLSGDGRWLLASDEDSTLQLFDVASGAALGRVGSPAGNVTDLAFSEDGRYLAAFHSGFFVWDLKAARIVRHRWVSAHDANGRVGTVELSVDGREVYVRTPVRGATKQDAAYEGVDVLTGQPVPVPGNGRCWDLRAIDATRFACAYTQDDESTVGIFEKGKSEPLKVMSAFSDPRPFGNGKYLGVDHLSYGSRFPEVWDTTTWARLPSDTPVPCRRDCTFKGIEKQVDPERVYSRLESPDGRWIAYGTVDGTVELRRRKDGVLAATLFMDALGGHVILLPNGFYSASRSALDRVAFRSGLKILGFDRYDLALNRPHEVLKALGHADQASIQAAEKAWLRRLQKVGLDPKTVQYTDSSPTLTLQDSVVTTGADSITLSVDVVAGKSPLAKLLVRVDGTPEGEPVAISGQKAHVDVPIRLIRGRNRVEISALDQKGAESVAETRTIERTTGPEAGKLYALGIGVSQYADVALALEYAAKDAKDVVSRISESRQFREHASELLLDQSVTKEKVAESGAFLRQSSLEDTAVVFIAGHGLVEDGEYYFGTYDLDYEHPSKRGLPYGSIEDLFKGVAARKRLVLIDTCNSGETDGGQDGSVAVSLPSGQGTVKARGLKKLTRPSGVTRALVETAGFQEDFFSDLRKGLGITVIASAGAREFALESKELQNGVFSYSILESLGNKSADRDKDGVVKVSELRDAVSNRVRELTAGQQNPTARRENLEADFPIE